MHRARRRRSQLQLEKQKAQQVELEERARRRESKDRAAGRDTWLSPKHREGSPSGGQHIIIFSFLFFLFFLFFSFFLSHFYCSQTF